MKTRYPVAAAAAGTLALAATALGNVAVTPYCDRAEAVTAGFPAGTPLTMTTAVDGAVVDTRAVTTPAAVSVPLSITGDATITATITARWGESWSGSAVVSCPTPAPVPTVPEPTPPPAVPPVVTPPPTTPPTAKPRTCADLRRVGAGRKWLVRFGCVTPRRALTCEILKARGAGIRWYVRLGIPWIECHPRPPQGPPAVTG